MKTAWSSHSPPRLTEPRGRPPGEARSPSARHVTDRALFTGNRGPQLLRCVCRSSAAGEAGARPGTGVLSSCAYSRRLRLHELRDRRRALREERRRAHRLPRLRCWADRHRARQRSHVKHRLGVLGARGSGRVGGACSGSRAASSSTSAGWGCRIGSRAHRCLEERMDDVRAVMDATDSSHAAIYGKHDGGAMGVLFAATYPERTLALILANPRPRFTSAPRLPMGADA